ncbi:hypothetical protein EV715DRAFT_287427 [Schizophyllum commune]
MDLPSMREIELEAALRQRDTQVAELTDEVRRLREHVNTKPEPVKTDPVTLPPAYASLLLPALEHDPVALEGSSRSGTITALVERAQRLQGENDELYNLLKQSETGKLKEEVRGLRRVVERLEAALRESHSAISSLSDELDKSYEGLMSSAQQHNNIRSPHSPQASLHGPTTSNGSIPTAPAAARLPPTGPRAHKKARLAGADKPASQQSGMARETSQSRGGRRRRRNADGGGGGGGGGGANANSNAVDMDVDARRSPEQGRGQRERDRSSEGGRGRQNGRNGGGGGGGGGAGTGGSGSSRRGQAQTSTDRTLAERMGL